MQTLQTFLFVLQGFVALTLIVFVLIQHGKGADTGAAFGSGASSTVFGSRGSGNFLTRTTTVLAAIFLANSLFLSYLSTQMVKGEGSLLDEEPSSLVQPQEGQQVDTAAAPALPAVSADMPQVDPGTAPADVPVIPATSEIPATSDIPEVPKQE